MYVKNAFLMKKVFLALPFLFFSLVSGAQTPIAPPDWSTPSKVAPLYFGPNAFPVPETPDGRVKKDIYWRQMPFGESWAERTTQKTFSYV